MSLSALIGAILVVALTGSRQQLDLRPARLVRSSETGIIPDRTTDGEVVMSARGTARTGPGMRHRQQVGPTGPGDPMGRP
jgi:hypothetical protein